MHHALNQVGSILFRMLLEYVCIAGEALALLGTRAAMYRYSRRSLVGTHVKH
jgi:hypothetical protein